MARFAFGRRWKFILREYLADLLNIASGLKSLEGKLAMVLVLLFMAVTVIWFLATLSFDRLNGVASANGVWRPRLCHSLDDFPAMVLVVDALVVALFGLMALGEMMILFDKARRKLSTRPMSVLVPAVLMLVSGVGGLIYMQSVC